MWKILVVKEVCNIKSLVHMKEVKQFNSINIRKKESICKVSLYNF